jgi:competence protein ComEA
LIVSVLTSTCVKRERSHPSTQPLQTESLSTGSSQIKRININIASAQELETLPGIGPALAERIIEHRNKYGPFRKPEHLIIMRGISNKRFQNLRDLITVE